MAPSYYVNSLCPVSIAHILACKKCFAHIASMDDFLSRGFSGAHTSRAGLFDAVSNTNVTLGQPSVWLMTSGAHTVRELFCVHCGSYVGWQIVHAHERPERWKDGAYVLERAFLVVRSVNEGYESHIGGASDSSGQMKRTPMILRNITELDGKVRHMRRQKSTVHS